MQLLLVFFMVFAFLLSACDVRTENENKENQSVLTQDLDQEENNNSENNEEL